MRKSNQLRLLDLNPCYGGRGVYLRNVIEKNIIFLKRNRCQSQMLEIINCNQHIQKNIEKAI